jgi:hypothetical protein
MATPYAKTCGYCEHWTQTHDRIIHNGKLTQPAWGDCAIHICLCHKSESGKPCCKGADWKGPVYRKITEKVIVDPPWCPIKMPWQHGYEAWAEKYPEQARLNDIPPEQAEQKKE